MHGEIALHLLFLHSFAVVFSQFQNKPCGRNEVFDLCRAHCQPSCQDPHPVCTFHCVAGCRCRRGFIRNSDGVCVRSCRPLPKPCGRNEVFDSCGAGCQPSCRDPYPVCTLRCVPGCRCRQNFLRNDNGVCVRNCPLAPISPSSCFNVRCPLGTHCEMATEPCARHPCPAPRPICLKDSTLPQPASCSGVKCQPGTHCEILAEPCTRLPCPAPIPKCVANPRLNQCDENEVFDACGSPCEPSCWDPFPQTCTFQCVIGCRCRNGFLRDYEGRCVRNCGRRPNVL